MPTARANLVVGPAKIVRGTGIVFTKENFAVRLDKATTPIVVDAYGKVDEREEDIVARCSFTPEGRWDSATRSFLWPYLNPSIGSDIFGTSDTATAIHDSNSHLHTIIASAVTKMPNIRLAANATMVGEVEIAGVRSNNTGWATSSTVYTAATSGGTLTDTGFANSLIKVQNYSAAWGSLTGFTTIQTEDGWNIEFDVGLQWIKTDEIGSVTAKLVSVGVMARCVPLNISQTNIDTQLRIQATGGARGRSYAADGADLVITGADTTTVVTIKGAALKTAGYRFGARTLRDGEMAWVATRGFSAGVAQALVTLA